MDAIWRFLLDEQNREALAMVGGLIAAMALAGWTAFKEFRITARRLDELSAEISQMKLSQADILRSLERSEQRHDLLFGVLVGKTVLKEDLRPSDESPADRIE